MHHIVDIIVGFVGQIGYAGIFLMMVIESSFIPFPSEVAMIPAGYLAAIWEMNIFIALFVGTLGAVAWATLNYYLGMRYWAIAVRSMIHKYGKYILIRESHYQKSEEYFASHGTITMLIGRFIPAVRQLISIPAGIFKMNYGLFVLLTCIGAGIWNAVLLTIWYVAGRNDELVKKLLSEAFLTIIVILWSIIFAYVYYVKNHKKELIDIEKTIEHNAEKVEKKKKHSKKK
jgi:membrane protein DedA with SNARE-associated domain